MEASDNHCAIHMMFIYEITGVKFCMPLRKFHDVILAANDAVAYTPCSQPHRKLLLTGILKFSQINF